MVGGRTFLIQVLRFANGCFIAVTEGNEGRIGALEVSIRARDGVDSSAIIPSMSSGIFPSILGEMSSNQVNGLSVVSVHLNKDLISEAAKEILAEVSEMLSEKIESDKTLD